ncbi:hypothetical protein Gorai_019331, partial [Gossypium raimondii]|nr:hypothetical protein [Gossypium raimondii]
ILHAVKALESSFGWQIGHGINERFGLNRWGFEGLDGNYLRASFNGNRDGLNGPPDRIVWFHNKSGCYSSKLGYSWLIFNKGFSRVCIQCGMWEEYTIHTLRNCTKSRAVLFFGGFDGHLLDNDYVRCIDWLEDVTHLLDLKAYENLITVLWNIWNSRNSAMFQGGCVMYRETWINVEWAKVEALREGIKWALNKNITREIFDLLESFTNFKIKWINCASNRVADCLCKLALNKRCTLSFNMEYPWDIHEFVVVDSC